MTPSEPAALDPLLASLLSDPVRDPLTQQLRPQPRRLAHGQGLRRAAVLVALTPENDPRVLLTVRATTLPTHSGQVSFAGGSLEAGESPAQAALREAWEEVGLEPERCLVLGEMDDVTAGYGFQVTPVLARFAPPTSWQLSGEVERVLLPRLSELRASAHQTTREFREQRITMRDYLAEGVTVWGMTAGVLTKVLEWAK